MSAEERSLEQLGFTPEEARAAAKRAAEGAMGLVALLPEAAAGYAELNPRKRRADGEAWEWVERIAERWRAAERGEGTLRTIEDDLVTEEANGLLGAIEDSLVLSMSADPVKRELALEVEEVAERVERLRQEGVFGPENPPPKPKRRPGGVAAGDVARFEALSTEAIAAIGENSSAYIELMPDGRELGAEQAARARERIDETAACCRALDAERELVAALGDRRDLRANLAVLRTMQHGFVLALSADRARRSEAISTEELAGRARHVLEAWQAEQQGG